MIHQVAGIAGEEIVLTGTAREILAARIARLRQQVIPPLAEARQDREDGLEVAEELQRATAELDRLSAVLGRARPADELPDDPGVVELGDNVLVTLEDGSQERYVIVHAAEAGLGASCISVMSPLGRALIGRGVGDEVDVAAPGGTYRCVILEAGRSS